MVRPARFLRDDISGRADTLAVGLRGFRSGCRIAPIRARLTPMGSPAQTRSALPSITDLRGCASHVRLVPLAEIVASITSSARAKRRHRGLGP
jgi:hypothetical protein